MPHELRAPVALRSRRTRRGKRGGQDKHSKTNEKDVTKQKLQPFEADLNLIAFDFGAVNDEDSCSTIDDVVRDYMENVLSDDVNHQAAYQQGVSGDGHCSYAHASTDIPTASPKHGSDAEQVSQQEDQPPEAWCSDTEDVHEHSGCGIPGIIPWWQVEVQSGKNQCSLTSDVDPNFKSILTGAFSHLSVASRRAFREHVQNSEENTKELVGFKAARATSRRTFTIPTWTSSRKDNPRREGGLSRRASKHGDTHVREAADNGIWFHDRSRLRLPPELEGLDSIGSLATDRAHSLKHATDKLWWEDSDEVKGTNTADPNFTSFECRGSFKERLAKRSSAKQQPQESPDPSPVGSSAASQEQHWTNMQQAKKEQRRINKQHTRYQRKQRRKEERLQKQEDDAAVSSSNVVPLPDTNIGSVLLRKLGWLPGTGLGAARNGMQTPVAVALKLGRRGLGFNAGDSAPAPVITP